MYKIDYNEFLDKVHGCWYGKCLGGAAGANMLADTENNLAVLYSHHMLNPQETYYQPRLRNVLYSCL